MPSLYIITRQPSGGIKIGQSINPPGRLSQLRQATPDRLELLWAADFGDRAVEIESIAKKLLKPWRISGEWFNVSPLVAGLAFEAGRDSNSRIDAFLARMATCYASRPDYAAEEAHEADVERDFPDIYPRIARLDPGTWTDWRGKTHPLPHKKFTRLMVEGCPETTYGCPPKPRHLQAIDQYKAGRVGRKLRA